MYAPTLKIYTNQEVGGPAVINQLVQKELSRSIIKMKRLYGRFFVKLIPDDLVQPHETSPFHVQ